MRIFLADVPVTAPCIWMGRAEIQALPTKTDLQSVNIPGRNEIHLTLVTSKAAYKSLIVFSKIARCRTLHCCPLLVHGRLWRKCRNHFFHNATQQVPSRLLYMAMGCVMVR